MAQKVAGRPGNTGRSMSNAGKTVRRDNFLPTAAFHACHENEDGTWTHFLCGGPAGDHECVAHNHFCPTSVPVSVERG